MASAINRFGAGPQTGAHSLNHVLALISVSAWSNYNSTRVLRHYINFLRVEGKKQ
uniref:Uncharacterized protein n=1 Tax=Pectobacterium carotovorum TaxID=554 RepID=A0A0N9NJU6_PECCA|nr:Hypothetical protein [Pectobacterium carotovorum]